jgi:rhodanese-related sulfurtransferase/DNA-binding transcriptional ArsR family regulator
MEAREVKENLFEQFARVLKAAAHPKRLELLDLLSQAERSVEELAAASRLKPTTASAQLQVLRQARLVSVRRVGKRVYYRITDPGVRELLSTVQRIAQAQLSEVAETVRLYFEARDVLEPISSQDLLRRLDAGEDLVVLDVRPRAEYDAGHIPGALSVPLEELTSRIDELPAGSEIVAYCRGPYCVLAPKALELLQAAGRDNVRRLEVGLPEWDLAGLPTQRPGDDADHWAATDGLPTR